MTTERSPRQIRLLTALLLFGTFLFGAVAGVGLSQWNHWPPHPPRPHAPFLPGPPGALNLTPVQDAKAHEITERYRPQLEAILRANFPKVQALNEQMERELRALLTPEQTKILDEMKAHRPPIPPGGPMPLGEGPPPGGLGFMPPPRGGLLPGGGPPPWPPGLAPPPSPPFGGPPSHPKELPTENQ
jgi:Spy/CpxP family protein refolding chaperone